MGGFSGLLGAVPAVRLVALELGHAVEALAAEGAPQTIAVPLAAHGAHNLLGHVNGLAAPRAASANTKPGGLGTDLGSSGTSLLLLSRDRVHGKAGAIVTVGN